MISTPFGRLLLSAADYDAFDGSPGSLAGTGVTGPHGADVLATALCYFGALWLVEWTSLAFMVHCCAHGPVLASAKNRGVLGRMVMNVVAFAFMGWAGIDALAFLGGWAAHAAPGASSAGYSFPGASHSLWDAMQGHGLKALLTNDASLGVGYGSAARIYLYVGRCQRLCVVQLVFQFKNFIDSVIHGDGVVFLLHHTATGTLAWLAMAPYLHLYAPFFFGISEISSLVVSVLVIFDDKMGIKGLGERYPNAMAACGGTFALLFVGFRVLIWPLVGLHFWRDGLSQLGYFSPLNFAGFTLQLGAASAAVAAPHNATVIGTIMGFNVALTLLQVIWLKEIFDQGVLHFSGKKVGSEHSATAGSQSRAASSASADARGRSASPPARRKAKSTTPKAAPKSKGKSE